jgi:Mn2+/Fe2+ NRAMP family transporter
LGDYGVYAGRNDHELLRTESYESARLAGIVQGFSTAPLLLLIMLLTNDPAVMGSRVNGRTINVLGWTTTIAVCAATAAQW